MPSLRAFLRQLTTIDRALLADAAEPKRVVGRHSIRVHRPAGIAAGVVVVRAGAHAVEQRHAFGLGLARVQFVFAEPGARFHRAGEATRAVALAFARRRATTLAPDRALLAHRALPE